MWSDLKIYKMVYYILNIFNIYIDHNRRRHMYLNLFIIALMIVYVYDLTDFPQMMLRVLWRYAYKSRPFPSDISWTDIHPLLKPLECSRCCVWWLTLIALLISGNISIPGIGWCMFLSYITPVIKDVLITIIDFITRMIDAFASYFGL